MNDLLEDLPLRFITYLDENGWTYDDDTAVDLLASALGSQFLLFAGPSGTGKSTAARALSSFFSGSARSVRIDTSPTWQALSDVVGYHSGLSDKYVKGPYFDRLSAFAEDGGAVPFLILEEANLAPIEAYLTEAMQDLSRLHAESLPMRLHSVSHSQIDGADVPQQLALSPYPRILATINVDAEAPAPVNKVIGRSCVVLLEPPSDTGSSGVEQSLYAKLTDDAIAPTGALGDPRGAISWYVANDKLGVLTDALDAETSRLEQMLGRNTVSKRDELRALLYMAYFAELAKFEPLSLNVQDAAMVGASNALLHFVLPTLPASVFKTAVLELADAGTSSPLLNVRLARLSKQLSDDVLTPIDFWACLT